MIQKHSRCEGLAAILNNSGARFMIENSQNPCTSPLRRVPAKAQQAVINGHETAKRACFDVEKSKYCSFCKYVSQTHWLSGHYFENG